MAGGGSTITLPMLLFMGLDAPTANGTNRIGILTQTASAVFSFKKRDHFDYKLSLKLSIFTLPGAILGSIYATKIDDLTFNILLVIVMIGIVINMLIPKKKKLNTIEKVKNMPFIIYPLMIGVGFYGGFVQVGVGFILMSILTHILNLKLVKVNMHKVFIVAIYTIPALLIFIISDNILYVHGIILAIGTAVGAWWSVKVSIKRGDRIIKIVLIIAILLISAKLINNTFEII